MDDNGISWYIQLLFAMHWKCILHWKIETKMSNASIHTQFPRCVKGWERNWKKTTTTAAAAALAAAASSDQIVFPFEHRAPDNDSNRQKTWIIRNIAEHWRASGVIMKWASAHSNWYNILDWYAVCVCMWSDEHLYRSTK